MLINDFNESLDPIVLGISSKQHLRGPAVITAPLSC